MSTTQKKVSAEQPKAEEFPDKKSLLKAYPDAQWSEYGPIYHYKEDKRFAQIYLGQDEWVIINVEDTDERYWDPGYEANEHGWAYVKFERWIDPGPNDNHPGHPIRKGSDHQKLQEIHYTLNLWSISMKLKKLQLVQSKPELRKLTVQEAEEAVRKATQQKSKGVK